MKTRLLKKVNSRIRIVKKNSIFVVEVCDAYTKWHKFREFKTFKDALYQKRHYIRTVLIKDFGLKTRYNKRFDFNLKARYDKR